ncbi:phage/plasmid primase, P4 family [Kitasatospora purpeofusca]|uniref:phage/plasmid primase, P4 family n=1 Tax=Kitasatospora purpeofusca TaxID=67352 RepID=UPI0036B54AA9
MGENMNMDDLVARIAAGEDRGQAPDGVVVPCPAHNDSKPSLVLIHHENGKVGLACRAGCKARDVISAAGLSMRDLFNVAPGTETRTVTSEPSSPVGPGLVAGLRAWLDGLDDGDDWALEYAFDRFGVEPDLFDSLGLRQYVPHGGLPEWIPGEFAIHPRLVVPMRDFAGVARGAQGRDLSGRCAARWMSLANEDGQVWQKWAFFSAGRPDGPVIIAEGLSDPLTIVAHGYDSIGIRGASLASTPEVIAELAAGLAGRVVLVVGDGDDAGRRFVAALAEALEDVRVLPALPEDTDMTDLREADPAAFRSRLDAAVASARPWEPPAAELVGNPTSEPPALRLDPVEAVDAYREAAQSYGASDIVNAHALVRYMRGGIKYAPGLGFHVFDGRKWVRDEVLVRQAAHDLGAALVETLAEEKRALRVKVEASVAPADVDAAYEKAVSALPLLKAAKGFTMTQRIDALIRELASVRGVHCDVDEFDNRPELVSFANGTVNLRTGELRPHAAADMLTKALPWNYNPEAKCPRWLRFMGEIFPTEPLMPDYMRRLTGYGITGSTAEQCFAVLIGRGANGKSVFLDTLTYVFGDLSETTRFETFEDRGNSIPADLAALRGSRMVMASEGEAGKPMSESVLKRATGSDKLTARFMRENFFTYQPTFLLWLASNHTPAFRSQDEGLWRRVKLIKFDRYFAPHERDHGIFATLREEAEGIAAWAVRGAIEWHRAGLGEPDCIVAATKNFKETSDALAEFFPDVMVKTEDEKDRVLLQDAYNAYRDWVEASGERAWTKRGFAAAMDERGVRKVRASAGMALTGVRMAGQLNGPAGPGIFGGDA